MVAAAVIGGAVIGAGASIYASNQASDAQTSAAQGASRAQMRMYNQTRADLLPYNQAGQGALSQLNMLMTNPGASQAWLEQTPGYQFAMTQGLKATQNQFAARGLGLSGAAGKGLEQYAAGLASQTFGDQWNRIMGVATLGENAAAQTGAYGTQTATNVGNNLIGAGNAQAAAALTQGQAIGNVGASIGNLYMTDSLLRSQGYTGIL